LRNPEKNPDREYLLFGKEIVKSSPVNPEILLLTLKKEKTTEGKIYSPVSKFAKRAKQAQTWANIQTMQLKRMLVCPHS